MLSRAHPPDQSYEYRITPLRWLEAELRAYGVTELLVPDMCRAHLDVIHNEHHLIVWLDTNNGRRCYRWGEPPTTHPLFDVEGAARRLATALGKGR